MLPVDLIVLAGGRGSRLGGALKPAVEVAGRTLLSRVLDARGFARNAVVVGPPAAQPAATAPVSVPVSAPVSVSVSVPVSAPVSAPVSVPVPAQSQVRAFPPLIWALEDPPFGGPVAGLAAGLAALDTHAGNEPHEKTTDGWVLVLACDLPWGADAARLLVQAASTLDADGVHLVDDTGHAQWLAAIYRASALRAAVARLGNKVNGASMRELLAGLNLDGLLDQSDAGTDVDTWQDVESSIARLTGAHQPDPRSDPE
ncbi:NTP transferase domain-containing protein [Cryobacterium sp. PH31-O1]|uniref:molybdenum cofactor guanylyltransferase n=1 Tax=Cryobacterium sp. PH31-O1 TaxID=3046306 RepID=UPI0024BB89F2|nr:NTP transferase domain-containing protein [Cryobacterium sp. PH31-O1]MDJ0338471.1 NTP transferase domain-containing protein [Cryobacterium sp. PH31-O1]